LAAAINLKTLNLSYNLFETYTIVNPNLKHILMPNNELTSFDTTNAVNLITINIRLNKITQLDISKNMLIEALNTGDNKLTSIGFGHKPELKHLACFSNFLTTLDVCGFDKLVYLSVNRNPDLSCVKIKSGQ
tara:strand:+ start:33501 stop:33896 length:396 start_codon:yes stop_codon:yes gene_type:complete